MSVSFSARIARVLSIGIDEEDFVQPAIDEDHVPILELAINVARLDLRLREVQTLWVGSQAEIKKGTGPPSCRGSETLFLFIMVFEIL